MVTTLIWAVMPRIFKTKKPPIHNYDLGYGWTPIGTYHYDLQGDALLNILKKDADKYPQAREFIIRRIRTGFKGLSPIEKIPITEIPR
jgi:hypothetical protein